MARNAQNVEKPTTQKATRTGGKVLAKTADHTMKSPVVVEKPRTNRGRKPEAIKDLIPKKSYTTRGDYVGAGWQDRILNKENSKINFSQTKSAKTAAKKIVQSEDNGEVAATIQMVTTDTSGNTTQPLPAEFAYNLMGLCSKYLFVMKGAFDGKDGITEIDIHIKVKPLANGAPGAVTC